MTFAPQPEVDHTTSCQAKQLQNMYAFLRHSVQYLSQKQIKENEDGKVTCVFSQDVMPVVSNYEKIVLAIFIHTVIVIKSNVEQYLTM